MKHSIVNTGIMTAVVSASASICAMPLSDYNLILLNDYNYQGGDVEGATLLGGDLNTQGQASDFGSQFTFGSKLGGDSVALAVIGDVNANNADIHVQNGDFVYGGALDANPVMNGGGSVYKNSSLDMSDIWSELNSASDSYAQLAANGSLESLTENQKQLTYSGDDSVAVFDYSAADLFAQNTSLMLDAGNAETVIINVSGADIFAGGGLNLTNGFNASGIGAANILWNFYEAQSIDFNNIAMWGAVLAVDADITGGAVFDGSVAASSYTGAREFHQFGFNEPPLSVSEPGTLALLMMGILALVRLRKTV